MGVSKKYGKRSLARYPIFWGLNNIGSLPNPDPNDIAHWDKNAKVPKAVIDSVQEEQRALLRVQAQEWAGIDIDSTAELFVFVGRWSEQKGIDLIADVFPKVLKNHPNTQLICIGPVIDLHGRFAALKLQKLMEQYPGRVCSKPEFTALPPCIFSGAEFALMPSRDEPFGLVAVEFGRKGALCVGSRVGGFGNMPGWWFTVEAVTSKHLIGQFNAAISAALSSDQETRALMRAYSVLQRFPVSQWVEDLESLQSSSIDMSFKTMSKPPPKWKRHSKALSNTSSANLSPRASGTQTPIAGSDIGASGFSSQLLIRPPRFSGGGFGSGTTSRASTSVPSSIYHGLEPSSGRASYNAAFPRSARESTDLTPHISSANIPKPLNLDILLSGNTKSSLQLNATPIFTDATNNYYDKFSAKLEKAALKPSTKMNIQEYIMASEKDWFNKFHDASMALKPLEGSTARNSEHDLSNEYTEFLNEDYQVPRGARRLLQMKLGTWYLYSYLLALVCFNDSRRST